MKPSSKSFLLFLIAGALRASVVFATVTVTVSTPANDSTLSWETPAG